MGSLARTCGRLRKSFLKRWYAYRRNPYAVRRLHYRDVFFLVNFEEKTDRLAILNRKEHEQLEKILAWSRENRPVLMLDVGANFGMYGVTIGHYLPDTRVLAFEPNAAARTRLAANALINGVTNLEVLSFAASSGDGDTPFISNVAGHSGISRVKDEVLLARMKKTSFRFDDANWEETSVETRAIDSLAREEGARIAVKIDTEGHECEVVRGMTRLLRDNDCYVQVEVSEKLPEHRQEMAALMAGLGYALRENLGPDFIYRRRPG